MRDAYLVGLEKTAKFSSDTVNRVVEFNRKMLPVAGMTALASHSLRSILRKIQNDTRRKALIEDLMSHDPIIKEAPKEEVLEYYATIYNLAPTVSLEKPVVRELLQHFVKFGRIDISTIKTLTDTEGKAQRRKQQSSFGVKDALMLSVGLSKGGGGN
jgi:hypothetical protein